MLKLAGSEACAWYGNRGGEFVAVGYVDVYVIVYKYLVIYYIFFKKSGEKLEFEVSLLTSGITASIQCFFQLSSTSSLPSHAGYLVFMKQLLPYTLGRIF